MKIGIVGAGTIVPDFLETCKKITQIEVQCISALESVRDILLDLQKKHQIKNVFTDYEELLNDDIETVYVAVPNHLHYQFAKEALKHKKHVILEKPFASNHSQAKELIELANKNNLVIFEAISNQYLPNYFKTKELLKDLGDMKLVQLNYSQYSRRYDMFKEGMVLPVFDPKQSGGALMDINVYNIHFIVGLFGKPTKITYIANVERGIDTSGILTLEYPTFQCVSIAAKDCKAPFVISLQGDKGCIYSEHPANVYGKFTLSTNEGVDTEYELNDYRDRLLYEIEYFLKIVGEKDYETVKKLNDHTLDVMEILDMGRRQAGIEF